MMREITREELERRAQLAKRDFKVWFDKVKEDPDLVPDKTVVLTWSDEEIAAVFTRERLRLFKKVKEMSYRSIKELADALRRDESRVRKDLKLLEGYGLVELVREGRRTRVQSDVMAIYIPVEGIPIEDIEQVRG
ncbi:MAG: hypothetical protein ACE5JP_16785 [Candidatus Bipolaricaulia bacterium]